MSKTNIKMPNDLNFLSVDEERFTRPRSGSTASCCGSAARRRSKGDVSPLAAKCATRVYQKHLNVEYSRPRSGSIPNNVLLGVPNDFLSSFLSPDDLELYRVREFSTSSKGIQNRGDAIRLRSRSSISVSSACSGLSGDGEEPDFDRLRSNSVVSQASSHYSDVGSCSSDSHKPYKVVMLGSGGVGRTSLMQQFTTSDDVETYDTTENDSSQVSVSVMLDGEESELFFTCPPNDEDECSHDDTDAFVIVYSVADKSSFRQATDVLYKLRSVERRDCAIILVGNKSDLARRRGVASQEAKAVATTYDCKFIETSAVLKLNADELLVGILSQIRLKDKRDADDLEAYRRYRKGGKRDSLIAKAAKGLVKRFAKQKTSDVSKSCENLFT